jgi:hypothetical protein
MAEYRDITRDAGALLKAPDNFTPVRGHYRPMRGQAYVMREKRAHGLIVVPDDPKKDSIHVGTVLDLGEPARLTDQPSSPVVPWDLRVGDRVYFVMGVWLDKMRTLEFVGVKGDVVVLAQGEIVGVDNGEA